EWLLSGHSPIKPRFVKCCLKCPLCSKFVASDEVEVHLVMCLTKPRISYNVCVVCVCDLIQGDTIARLPCLCVYHKPCIDSWFEVNRTCPEHPSD
uniref:RING-type E3 ubiquitin transferase n=1 Tax=Eptatretus burgeri TaxID=7764 RepID=A0A8C4WW00_EPTBU